MQNFYNQFHPIVIKVETTAERETGERILGKDPKTGKQVYCYSEYGVAQIGDIDDEEKTICQLATNQNISTIALEEALNLFLLPKSLGEYQGEKEVNNGRFGPYVKFGNQFISLPKGMDATSKCKTLEQEKAKADARIGRLSKNCQYKKE